MFDGLELDAARFELRRGELCLPVQPKVLRLLFYLVAHRERVVSGDELLEGWSICRPPSASTPCSRPTRRARA